MSIRDSIPLWEKLRALAANGADEDTAKECLKLAADFEAASNMNDATWSAKRMLGTWARARLKYCELTGEPLA